MGRGQGSVWDQGSGLRVGPGSGLLVGPGQGSSDQGQEKLRVGPGSGLREPGVRAQSGTRSQAQGARVGAQSGTRVRAQVRAWCGQAQANPVVGARQLAEWPPQPYLLCLGH